MLGKHFLAIGSALILFGCGDAAQTPDLSSLIGSSWQGNFSPNLKEALADATKVKVDFNSDKSFLIAPTEAAITGLVKGTYTDMPRNSMMLFDLQESTYDLLGKSGTTQDYSYELAGDELVLEGSAGKYLLLRNGGDGDGNDAVVGPLEGDWYCSPGDSSKWHVNLSKTTFRGSRSDGNSRTLFFEGSVDALNKEEGNGRAHLNIESSNYDPLTGTILLMQQTGEKTASIRQLDKDNDPVGAEIKCRR